MSTKKKSRPARKPAKKKTSKKTGPQMSAISKPGAIQEANLRPMHHEAGVNMNGKVQTLYYPGSLAPIGENVRGSRVSIPRGLQALLFKPNNPLSEEMVRLLIDLKAIPASWPMPIKREVKPVESANICLDELGRHSHEEQNRIIATLVKTVLEKRESEEKYTDNSRRRNEIMIQDSQANIGQLKMILAGDYKVLSF